MNSMRRTLLKLFGAAGATAVSYPALALADRIRILPDAGATNPPTLEGQTSPELTRTLRGLSLGAAATQGAISVLWLRAKETAGPPALEVLTFEESRARGAVTVVERAQASVPELIAENRGKTYVLLLAGEILIGGKQNRVLREDLLLPPRSGPRNISVYCVVQPGVRAQLFGRAEQSQIWSGVAAASRRLAAPSPTGSYQAVYEKPEVQAHLDTATRAPEMAAAPGAVGASVFVGQDLAGVDAFHSPGLFSREWPKLLRAYALDAYGRSPSGWDETAGRARTEGLLRGAAGVPGTLRGNAGAGRLLEFSLDGRRGAALVFEGAVIHLAIV
jgi:hypothetical protein